MTTIAYRNGVMAADSLTTSNGARDGIVRKIDCVHGVLIGAAGSLAACQAFRAWVIAGMQGPDPFRNDDVGNGLLVAPDGTLVVFSVTGPATMQTPFYALGSGYQFAMGAMAYGATAEEAVRVARQFDTQTGGEIITLRRGVG